MKLKRWHIWLGVAISAVFLYLAFRKVDFSLVWQYLKQAQWSWVLLGLAVYFFGVLLRAWRWQILLNPLKRLPIRRLFPVVAIGYMGNNVYPARAGEVPQPVEFPAGGQRNRAGVTEATGTDERVRCEENADLLPVPDRGQAHRATGHNRRTTRWPFRSNCSGVRAKAAQKTPSRHPDWPGRAPTRSCPACHQNSQLQ